jgi:hypothetical protein
MHRSMFAADGSHPDGPRGTKKFRKIGFPLPQIRCCSLVRRDSPSGLQVRPIELTASVSKPSDPVA